MMRYCLAALCWTLLWLGAAQPPADWRRLEETRQQAVRLLRQSAVASNRGSHKEAARLLSSAAQAISRLARDEDGRLPAEPRKRLERLSLDLAALGAPLQNTPRKLLLDPYLAVLDELGRSMQDSAPELSLRPTYAGARLIEQGGGGHAMAPGPAPRQRSSPDDVRETDAWAPAVLDFRAMDVIPEKNFSGGPGKEHILESGGGGVALFDYDNDGLLDIYIVNSFELAPDRKPIPRRNRLYRNLGNWKFEDVSRKAGVDAAAWGYGVCVGDYNNDGFLDLYVTNFGPNFLYRNNGDGTFREVAAQAGVNHSGWSTGCGFFDSRGDGRLDLYVARYAVISLSDVFNPKPDRVWRGGPRVMSGPVGLPGASDVFYRNSGEGTFSEATANLGLARRDDSYGLGVLTTDYDNDGRIDVFVANDSNPNFLFHNLGNGRFQEAGVPSGAGVNADGRAQAGMGVDAGDYDGDGLIDIVVTNFAHDTNTLYRNLGGGFFEDVSLRTGLFARTFERMGWGVAFLDADRDGALDLFFANGHLFPQVDRFPELRETYRQKSQLLMNKDGAFKDLSDAAGEGLALPRTSRGLALGDLDNDGALDLVITNMDDVPTVLRNRTRAANHWAGFQLAREGPNRFCIGARVVISAGGSKQIREIRSGGGYLSQNDLRVYFGLGSYSGKLDVEVFMPGGTRWRWNGLPPDRLTTLVLREDRRLPP